MTASKWDQEVPFIDGEMQEWIDWQPWHGKEKPTEQRWNKKQIVWEKAQQFGATLLFDYSSKGRSAVRFHFIDKTHLGRRYSMTLTAFEEAIKTYGMVYQQISGMWTFKKVGQNYTLTPAVKPKGSEDALKKIDKFLNSGKVISEEELEAELDKAQRVYEDGPL